MNNGPWLAHFLDSPSGILKLSLAHITRLCLHLGDCSFHLHCSPVSSSFEVNVPQILSAQLIQRLACRLEWERSYLLQPAPTHNHHSFSGSCWIWNVTKVFPVLFCWTNLTHLYCSLITWIYYLSFFLHPKFWISYFTTLTSLVWVTDKDLRRCVFVCVFVCLIFPMCNPKESHTHDLK